ncbi:MAG TPA: hypothetical protein VLU46_08340 [Thermoanaerobaculia bacterium]|nr:hypothetical protein [Thermoanaerobaculia bacterium]
MRFADDFFEDEVFRLLLRFFDERFFDDDDLRRPPVTTDVIRSTIELSSW